jgi:oxygen-independent coproporphyrinogen-3 oxidase
MQDNLIQKYNIPGPRYTSYPTVPYWEEDSIDPEKYFLRMSQAHYQAA